MSSPPQEHSRFSVISGCLCFGDLHNIWHGASNPPQGFPIAEPVASGTVVVHELKHNVSAKNGTWITYQLVDIRTQIVKAWFTCHIDIDPEDEINKILRVSPSPYEFDNKGYANSAETAAEGVLVINRYDWGYYDKISSAEFEDDGEEPENDELSNSVGLVDYNHAKEQFPKWKEETTSQRSQPSYGAWLYIPRAEYMFGRFGFDDTHPAARSFIFFTESTYFMKTAFLGLSKSLVLEETPLEMFHRKVREGEKYEGFEALKMMLKAREGEEHHRAPELRFPGRPDLSDCLGPYDKSEQIFSNTEFEVLIARLRGTTQVVGFINPLKEPVFDLLNEMIMSDLEHFIIQVSSSDSILAAATVLCPKHGASKNVDSYIYNYLMNPQKDSIPGLDIVSVESHIKKFLQLRCGKETLVDNDKYSYSRLKFAPH